MSQFLRMQAKSPWAWWKSWVQLRWKGCSRNWWLPLWAWKRARGSSLPSWSGTSRSHRSCRGIARAACSISFSPSAASGCPCLRWWSWSCRSASRSNGPYSSLPTWPPQISHKFSCAVLPASWRFSRSSSPLAGCSFLTQLILIYNWYILISKITFSYLFTIVQIIKRL